MATVCTTVQRLEPRQSPLSLPLLRNWTAFIQAMEVSYAAPVR